jgi:peptide subunit release factor 1 (eRF1)
MNIKDKKRRKQVKKTLNRIIKKLRDIPSIGKGFIIFGAYDGV